jgi:hypothetical protein
VGKDASCSGLDVAGELGGQCVLLSLRKLLEHGMADIGENKRPFSRAELINLAESS